LARVITGAVADLNVGSRESGQAVAGDGCQFRAQLDGGDGQLALSERHSRLPGATPDLDHLVSCYKSCALDQVVE
jgi:hypothetical protein